MTRSSSKRRPAAAWAKLVAAWQRSGLRADTFAAQRGLRPTTLVWWRWRLASDRRPQRGAARTPRLVPVEIIADADAQQPTAIAWELESDSGLVLRVTKGIAQHELERVLAAMGATSRTTS